MVPSGSGSSFQSGGAKLKFEEDNHDFGKMADGDIAEHVFKFTNTGTDTVKIAEVKASCGCSAVLVSSFNIPPREGGEIKTTFNSRGKLGKIKKTIQIRLKDNGSVQVISFTALVESKMGGTHPGDMTGSYFEGKCVNCHVEPGAGKFGKELFAVSCAMCHGEEGHGHVALAMNNPDYLKKVDNTYLEKRIAEGSPNNKMMLGFSPEHHGPLDKAQIKSLVEYIRSWEKNN